MGTTSDVAKWGIEYRNELSPMSTLAHPSTLPRFEFRVKISTGKDAIRKPISYPASMTPDTVELS